MTEIEGNAVTEQPIAEPEAPAQTGQQATPQPAEPESEQPPAEQAAESPPEQSAAPIIDDSCLVRGEGQDRNRTNSSGVTEAGHKSVQKK